MNRRELIATLAGLPLAIKAAIAAPLGYGFVDVEKHLEYRRKGIWLRVMFNGEDVTNRCREANDKTGRILLYTHKDGWAYVDWTTRECAMEVLYGDVRFVRAEPWA